MGEQLKKMFFTEDSLNKFGDIILKYHPGFDKAGFLELIHDDTWKSLELKEKMRHTTICLQKKLPESFNAALEIIKKAAPHVKGFEAMTLPDYVELYGKNDWELSLPALGHFTKYSSSEFAIRPYLDENPEKAMEYMLKWAEEDDEKVRRFASEGCRPRLPWAMALPKFKKDPAPVLELLEKLKNDESEFVRRSVANNLNDISKDNPETTLDICTKWYGNSKNTDAIVKHACRTMLKAGNKRAMILFGFGDPSNIMVENLKTGKDVLYIGEKQQFTFDLAVNENKKCKVRLEYAVYYMKANGKHNKKVFKITENSFGPGRYPVKRNQSFEDMSTRKHYEGEHQISIIVNGKESAKTSFELKKK